MCLTRALKEKVRGAVSHRRAENTRIPHEQTRLLNLFYYRIKPTRGSPDITNRKDTHRRLPTLLRSSVPHQARGSRSWSRGWYSFFVGGATSSSCFPTGSSH